VRRPRRTRGPQGRHGDRGGLEDRTIGLAIAQAWLCAIGASSSADDHARHHRRGDLHEFEHRRSRGAGAGAIGAATSEFEHRRSCAAPSARRPPRVRTPTITRSVGGEIEDRRAAWRRLRRARGPGELREPKERGELRAGGDDARASRDAGPSARRPPRPRASPISAPRRRARSIDAGADRRSDRRELESGRRRACARCRRRSALGLWRRSKADPPRGRIVTRQIQGLRNADGERIVTARRHAAFASVADFVARARLPARAHAALAEAGALASLDQHGSATRRAALWQVRGWVARQNDTLTLGGTDDDALPFSSLTASEEIRWDYGTSGHSTRGHPLAPLRTELRACGWPDARSVQRGRDGQRIDYVGMVICRQQPSTASGVVFMTLEDETGFVNLVVWRAVLAEYGLILRTAAPLGVSGRLQVQERVVHLIVERAWEPSLSRSPASVASRDFR
jgi:hypothetical protein